MIQEKTPKYITIPDDVKAYYIEKGRQIVFAAGDTYCLDGKKHGRATNYANVKKRECRGCWQALKGR